MCFVEKVIFVLLKHPSGLLMQLAEYCVLSHLFFCSKTQTLVFCSGPSCTQVCGYSDNSCFSYVAWSLFSWGISLSSMNSDCFLSKTYLIISTFFLCLLRKTDLNTRPQQASKLFWSLPLVPSLQFVNPCLTAWICSSWTVLCHCWQYSPCSPFFTCPVERCVCRARFTLTCCKVLAAQSCSAISRLLKLNLLYFHTSCSLCILGCGRHSLFACQNQLFCTWKAPLSPLSSLQAWEWL